MNVIQTILLFSLIPIFLMILAGVKAVENSNLSDEYCNEQTRKTIVNDSIAECEKIITAINRKGFLKSEKLFSELSIRLYLLNKYSHHNFTVVFKDEKYHLVKVR